MGQADLSNEYQVLSEHYGGSDSTSIISVRGRGKDSQLGDHLAGIVNKIPFRKAFGSDAEAVILAKRGGFLND
jgi:hypothetical protein